MAERGRAQARAAAWSAAAVARARRAAAGAAPSSLQDLGFSGTERLRNYAAAEAGAGRLMPWLPVAFGFGIVVYFTAEQEPALWATVILAAISVAMCNLAARAAFRLLGCAGSGDREHGTRGCDRQEPLRRAPDPSLSRLQR